MKEKGSVYYNSENYVTTVSYTRYGMDRLSVNGNRCDFNFKLNISIGGNKLYDRFVYGSMVRSNDLVGHPVPASYVVLCNYRCGRRYGIDVPRRLRGDHGRCCVDLARVQSYSFVLAHARLRVG